ncbi:hypothetical protein Taro_034410 [Colocasia esculenta]|uniref:Uncharacterized protein n=1 Tax=Colocasia esculenta TaxID=4460 RepID=A0A843VWB7_COLES|nr:hypothetical protein [Colocasia esculenta]
MATPPPHHSRRDLTDLRSRISRKLGPERAQRYFSCLNRLLGQKLSKSEFDKLCLVILGRENIPLHNQFIRLILRNACQAKVPPPPVPDRYSLRPGKTVGKKSPPADDWFHPSPTVASATSVLSNGEILSPSPCRSRSTNNRFKDQSSPLGSNGKTDAFIHQLHAQSDEIIGGKCDSITSVQQQQLGEIAALPTKKQRVEKPLPRDQVSAHTKGPSKVVIVENGEELVRTEYAQSNRGLICAPLGIPFCPLSAGGACRPAPASVFTSNDGFASNSCSGELCHTEALKKRMEQIAGAQDLGGVTMECANLLNHGLDVYLKRLIKSCVDLVGARTGHEPIKQPLLKQQSLRKTINGIWQGTHMHVQGYLGSLDSTQEAKSHHQVSLLDFRVAMELNPRQLGEHWPMLLEKV